MTTADRPIADPRKPEDRWWPPEDWPERIKRAKEAHRAGKRLREGKQATSPEQP